MPSKQRYAFRIPRHGPDVDAQVIGEFIEELIDAKNEHVTHEELIAAARKSDSPLRPCFTFDDAEAAAKWRKREAKELVKNIHTEKDGKLTRTRAFVYVHHPKHEGRKVLLTTRSAMARPEFREQVIAQAVHLLQRQLTYWGHAY